MKPRHPAARPHEGSCQRPGCSNWGKLRTQKRAGGPRKLFLCDGCLESLPACQLRDLFLRFAGQEQVALRL